MQMSYRRFASSAFVLCIVFCCRSSPANADQVIETIAGTGLGADGGDGGSALHTNIGKPFGMAIGPDGALYFAEYGTHRVRRLDLKTGTLTNIAGIGQAGYSGDGGPATNACAPRAARIGLRSRRQFVRDRYAQFRNSQNRREIRRNQHRGRLGQARVFRRRRIGDPCSIESASQPVHRR